MLSTKKLIYKILQCPHVVEQGTSGIWTYRKWSDGTAECWGTVEKNMSVGANSSTSIAPPNLPSNLFIELPIVLTTGGGTSNANIIAGYAKSIVTDGDYRIDAYMRNMTGTAFSNTLWMYVHVIGKWK